MHHLCIRRVVTKPATTSGELPAAYRSAVAGAALGADPPCPIVTQADPVDVFHHELLDEGIPLAAAVYVDLAIARDLADLAVVFVVAPAVGTGTLGRLVGGLLGGA